MSEYCVECYLKEVAPGVNEKELLVSKEGEFCEGCNEIKQIVLSQEDKSPYISIYHPICGWKAIMYAWYDDEQGGMWDVAQTGMMGYRTEREAIIEAIDWAKAAEVRYTGPALEPAPKVAVVLINGEYYVHCGVKKTTVLLLNKQGNKLALHDNPKQPMPVVKQLRVKYFNYKWYFETKIGVFSVTSRNKVKQEAILRLFK